MNLLQTTKQRTSLIQQPLIPTGPRVACRSCRVVFEDLNGRKLCDSCLVDRVNGAGELEDDDPDDVINQVARITCRVCGLGVTVPLDHPALLCLLCLEDLDGTRDRTHARLGAALTALETNQAAWNTLRAASPAYDRWEAVEKALIGVAEKRIPKATLDQTWAKRKAEGGALADLLTAYEAYARECDRMRAELDRLDSAQTEINAAWLSTPMEELEHTPRPNEYAIPDDATPTTCRSCGTGMVFIQTPAGKALPLSVATIQTRAGVRYALPHFTDCKDAKSWSKK